MARLARLVLLYKDIILLLFIMIYNVSIYEQQKNVGSVFSDSVNN